MKFKIQEQTKNGWEIVIDTNFEISETLEKLINETKGVYGYVNVMRYSASLRKGKLFKTECVIKELKKTINNYINTKDLSKMNFTYLKVQLQNAINREDYESASLINQEIKNRKV